MVFSRAGPEQGQHLAALHLLTIASQLLRRLWEQTAAPSTALPAAQRRIRAQGDV